MTMMKILEQKQYLKKTSGDRAYVYRPAQPKGQVIGDMVREFVNRVFNGSAEPLLVHLVEEHDLSPRGAGRDCAPAEEAMNPQLIWGNLVAYSMQIGLLVGLAAFIPSPAAAALARAQAGLLADSAGRLPAAARGPALEAGSDHASTLSASPRSSACSPLLRSRRRVHFPWETAHPGRCSAGRAAAWPGSRPDSGAWPACVSTAAAPPRFRLRAMEVHSTSPLRRYLEPGDLRLAPAGDPAARRVSPELDPAMQEAILCHELLHVRARDWLFTVAEELVRAIFWFHPAIWWLLGEISLAREQVVDREVVRTHAVARSVCRCAARHRRRKRRGSTWPRRRCSCASGISGSE